MKLYIILAGVLLVVVSAKADGVYRWEDKTGKVYYGDRPAQDSVRVESMELGNRPMASEDLPYETRRANENFPVTFYVSGNCGNMCADARDFLDKRGIPFLEKTLSSKQEIDAFKLQSGGEVVPAILVGKNWIKGFQAELWNSELDAAGYPKTSPYRNSPAIAKQPANNSVTEESSPEPADVEMPDIEMPEVESPSIEESATDQ